MASADLELVKCYNKGCGQDFKPDQNTETSCTFHPGGPIFHDALKGWSCCKKKVTDFTEFLNIKGCTTGLHCNVKPPEPIKQETPKSEETMVQLTVAPNHRLPVADRPERAPDDEPLVEISASIGATLKTQLEKLSLNNEENGSAGQEDDDKSIKIGTSCNNRGCKSSYKGEDCVTECIHHPGFPIFHEGMKYWTCCQKKTSDFEAFLNQQGCETGPHNFIKPKVQENKQVRVDWHQTGSIVCISVFAKVAIPDQTVIKANRVLCEVSLVYDGGSSVFNRTFSLREMIDPSRSSVKLLGTKVEINLKKADGMSWPSLELESKKD